MSVDYMRSYRLDMENNRKRKKTLEPMQNFCKVYEELNTVTRKVDTAQKTCAAPSNQAYRCTFFKFKCHDTCEYMEWSDELDCTNKEAYRDAMTNEKLEQI